MRNIGICMNIVAELLRKSKVEFFRTNLGYG